MVVRLTIAYLGTRYSGWQHQENGLSVQQVVEEALAELFGRHVRIRAASRTDAGVHARAQMADVEPPVERSLRALVHGTNHGLPPDVRILAADRMPSGFSSRRCNVAKEYRYRLRRSRVISPFDADRVVSVSDGIRVDLLEPVLAGLVGTHDFSAFALQGGSHTHGRRRLFAASLMERGPDLEIRFVGEGFLRGMVRGLVGTLLEVGAARRTGQDMLDLLDGGSRDRAGPNAPAHGLTLERIVFPRRWRPLGCYRADGSRTGDPALW